MKTELFETAGHTTKHNLMKYEMMQRDGVRARANERVTERFFVLNDILLANRNKAFCLSSDAKNEERLFPFFLFFFGRIFVVVYDVFSRGNLLSLFYVFDICFYLLLLFFSSKYC